MVDSAGCVLGPVVGLRGLAIAGANFSTLDTLEAIVAFPLGGRLVGLSVTRNGIQDTGDGVTSINGFGGEFGAVTIASPFNLSGDCSGPLWAVATFRSPDGVAMLEGTFALFNELGEPKALYARDPTIAPTTVEGSVLLTVSQDTGSGCFSETFTTDIAYRVFVLTPLDVSAFTAPFSFR